MGAAEHKALGTIYVTAVILKTGKVKVKGAAGNHMLTQAASDAIADWRFQPYKIDGQPVDVEVIIPYVFDAKPFVPWPGGIEPPPPAPSQSGSLIATADYSQVSGAFPREKPRCICVGVRRRAV